LTFTKQGDTSTNSNLHKAANDCTSIYTLGYFPLTLIVS